MPRSLPEESWVILQDPLRGLSRAPGKTASPPGAVHRQGVGVLSTDNIQHADFHLYLYLCHRKGTGPQQTHLSLSQRPHALTRYPVASSKLCTPQRKKQTMLTSHA